MRLSETNNRLQKRRNRKEGAELLKNHGMYPVHANSERRYAIKQMPRVIGFLVLGTEAAQRPVLFIAVPPTGTAGILRKRTLMLMRIP